MSGVDFLCEDCGEPCYTQEKLWKHEKECPYYEN